MRLFHCRFVFISQIFASQLYGAILVGTVTSQVEDVPRGSTLIQTVLQ